MATPEGALAFEDVTFTYPNTRAPARTTVAVRQLPRPELNVEIRAKQLPQVEQIARQVETLLKDFPGTQAVIAEGGQLEDPAAFVKRVNALMLEMGGK